jgi:hypothetical protein
MNGTKGNLAQIDRLRDLFSFAFRTIQSYVNNPENRLKVGSIALFFVSIVIYTPTRSTSDLVGPLLSATRDLVYLGENVFSEASFNSYSPFFYCVMAFVAPFADWFSAMLWCVINICLYLGINAVIMAIIARSQPERKTFSYFIAPLLTLVILADNLYLGQTNIFPFLFTCCALFAYQRKRHFSSGLLLSVAVAYKVTPILFAFHYVLRRRIRALTGLVVGLILCLLVVPSFYFGPAKSVQYVTQWGSLVIMPFVTGEDIKTKTVNWDYMNQSLEGALHRHLTPLGKMAFGGMHKVIDPAFLNAKQAAKLAVAIKALLLLVIAWVMFKYRNAQERSFPFEISLIFMAILYISPVTWISYYIVILFPYAVAVNEIIRRPRGETGRRLLTVGLWAAMLISAFNLTPRLQSYSFLFFGNALFFLCFLAYTLFFLQEEDPAPGRNRSHLRVPVRSNLPAPPNNMV